MNTKKFYYLKSESMTASASMATDCDVTDRCLQWQRDSRQGGGVLWRRGGQTWSVSTDAEGLPSSLPPASAAAF